MIDRFSGFPAYHPAYYDRVKNFDKHRKSLRFKQNINMKLVY